MLFQSSNLNELVQFLQSGQSSQKETVVVDFAAEAKLPEDIVDQIYSSHKDQMDPTNPQNIFLTGCTGK